MPPHKHTLRPADDRTLAGYLLPALVLAILALLLGILALL